MFVFIQKQEKSLSDVSFPKENLKFHVVSCLKQIIAHSHDLMFQSNVAWVVWVLRCEAQQTFLHYI